MNILLTNDDSHGSPLFAIIIEKLSTLGSLTIVVPNEEQSWTGKSISYSRRLHVEQFMLNSYQAYCVNGKPADCINSISNGTQPPSGPIASAIRLSWPSHTVSSKAVVSASASSFRTGVPAADSSSGR